MPTSSLGVLLIRAGAEPEGAAAEPRAAGATRSFQAAPARPANGTGPSTRVRVDGNHLSRKGAPFRVKGTTYGSFAARPDGYRFPDSGQIKRDLAAMKEAGLNALRTYTLPPAEF
ncbi:MAG: hypothetical protein ACRDLB_16760, partial [Actinomycetota bacterium]